MTGGLSYKEIVNIRTKQTDAEIEAQDDTGTKIKLRNGKVSQRHTWTPPVTNFPSLPMQVSRLLVIHYATFQI